MTHCHFPKGEWSVTVYCPLRQNAVFAHIAPTEGEDMEERREWGVSPHAAKRDGTSQEGRGDTTEGATTGGERDDNIHENRTQYRLETNSGLSTSLSCLLSNCYISLINVISTSTISSESVLFLEYMYTQEWKDNFTLTYTDKEHF